MAQAGFTPISLYHTTTASAVPTSGNLVAGELALNTLDEKLYFKNSGGTVKLLAANVTAVANGGTGQTSFTNGQLLIGNTTGNTLTKTTLTAGTGITITNSTGSITIASTSTSTDLLENVQTIASNYTITASKNALAVGPVTINTGISVTVGTGQRWLILN